MIAPIRKKAIVLKIKHTGASNKHSTLCWDCEKACGKCSWSKKFIPVEGWVATPTKVSIGENQYIDSFDVYECPEFELLKMLKMPKVAKTEKERPSNGKYVDRLLRRKYNG